MSNECFQPLGSGGVCRILCVDDDTSSQRLLLAALARGGCAIECACDGAYAVQRFAADAAAFDVLVTNHAIPEGGGLALVSRLRTLGYDGEVIVIGAEISDAQRMSYLEWGCRGVLPEPLDARRLREVVEAALPPKSSASAL